MQEIWRDIKGYEGLYQVSSWGNVRNSQGRIMYQEPNYKGYPRVRLIKSGVKKNKRVNRLVAEAFIPNPYGLPQVNHKDGNKRNNSFSNLEWITQEMNISHAIRYQKGQVNV